MNIARAVLDAIVAHARESAPEECCGLLIGRGDVILDSVQAGNLSPTPRVRFLVDPQDHFGAVHAARPRGLEVVGFYHSHPASGALPSETDLAEWIDTELVSVIVALDTDTPRVRAFSRREGELVELPLTVD